MYRSLICGGVIIAIATSPTKAQTLDLKPTAGAAAAQPQPVRQNPPELPGWVWRRFAREDLTSARELLLNNSPFVHVDRDSAAMRNWLDEGYRLARAMVQRVTSETGYRFLVDYYLTGFRDGHIRADFHDGYRPKAIASRAWPGIATAWRAGRYEVAFVAPWVMPAPAVGAQLIACDGRPAEEVARSRVDLFEADLDQPLQRRRAAFRLLWDRGNPFVQNLDRCTFRARSGAVSEVKLDYRPLEQDAARDRAAAVATAMAVRPNLEAAKWGSRGWWIGIPTLEGDGGWEPLYATIQSNLASIRSAPTIVLDLRGNGGGSGAYAERLARSIWGSTFVDAHRPSLGPVAWRASQATVDKILGWADRMASNPTEAPDAAAALRLAAAVEKAVAERRPLYHEPYSAPARPSGPPPSNPVRGRIVLLTDERCFSACLDLMDLFLAMPGVVQAGQPTGSDTIFMDVAGGTLPSGRYAISYGTKAWLERPRGSNVPYRPAAGWLYEGDPADETSWRAWLARRLESRR